MNGSTSKIIGLIPSRLSSKRLPGKALADIGGLPVVIHTAKRALMAKSLDKVYVCTDSEEIETTCKYHNIDCILTSNKFSNGTERIASVCDQFDSQFFIDIQGDEPLIDPSHIDQVASELTKTSQFNEIILPILRVPYSSNETIVRVQVSKSGRVMTLTRAFLPHRYTKTMQFVFKHLSIIGFTRDSLNNYASLPPSPNEECESIELLRALENDMNIGTIVLQGDSFSVDIQDDLDRARIAMVNDPLFGKYK